jgi:MFS family permease
MEAELGWSRSEVAGAFSVALLASGLAAVPVGHWLDRHGPRALMTAGSLLGVALLVAWSRVTSLAAFYAIWAGIGLALAAVLYEPAFAVVARWFVRRRHRALTILTVFGGLASTVFVPLATWLLERHGWRGAVLRLAAVLGVVTVPLHALLLRKDPSAVGAGPDGEAPGAAVEARPASEGEGWRATVKTRAFWAVATAFALASFSFVAATVHLVPYLLQRDVRATTAAAIVGLIGAMQLPGRLFFGPLMGRMERRRLTASVFALQAAALASLPFTSGVAGLAAAASGLGLANGMATILRASTVAEAFGLDHYGKIGGGIAAFSVGARAAGPIAAALAYSALRDYRAVFLGLGAVTAAAALVSWGPRRAAFGGIER